MNTLKIRYSLTFCMVLMWKDYQFSLINVMKYLSSYSIFIDVFAWMNRAYDIYIAGYVSKALNIM